MEVFVMPETVSRVQKHTAPHINKRIMRETECNIAYFSVKGDAAIDQRLEQLNREWDIERVLQVNASIVGFTGVALGALVKRSWLFLPTAVLGFLFQHAVQGWCPPVSLLRRLGFRTSSEIDAERYALKALRGDFKELEPTQDSFSNARLAIRASNR